MLEILAVDVLELILNAIEVFPEVRHNLLVVAFAMTANVCSSLPFVELRQLALQQHVWRQICC